MRVEERVGEKGAAERWGQQRSANTFPQPRAQRAPSPAHGSRGLALMLPDMPLKAASCLQSPP